VRAAGMHEVRNSVPGRRQCRALVRDPSRHKCARTPSTPSASARTRWPLCHIGVRIGRHNGVVILGVAVGCEAVRCLDLRFRLPENHDGAPKRKLNIEQLDIVPRSGAACSSQAGAPGALHKKRSSPWRYSSPFSPTDKPRRAARPPAFDRRIPSRPACRHANLACPRDAFPWLDTARRTIGKSSRDLTGARSAPVGEVGLSGDHDASRQMPYAAAPHLETRHAQLPRSLTSVAIPCSPFNHPKGRIRNMVSCHCFQADGETTCVSFASQRSS
jgi:hypothetical protein